MSFYLKKINKKRLQLLVFFCISFFFYFKFLVLLLTTSKTTDANWRFGERLVRPLLFCVDHSPNGRLLSRIPCSVSESLVFLMHVFTCEPNFPYSFQELLAKFPILLPGVIFLFIIIFSRLSVRAYYSLLLLLRRGVFFLFSCVGQCTMLLAKNRKFFLNSKCYLYLVT